jgi:putative transposase
MSNAMTERPEHVSVKKACEVLCLNRSTAYQKAKRAKAGQVAKTSRKHAPQPRALNEDERAKVVEMLVSETYRDQPPMEIYHDLLDQGVHLCSVRTMHRILHQEKASGDRRNQRPAQKNAVPRLQATAPNQVYTWDITKLASQGRVRYLSLYVVMDLFSRFVVAWMVSVKENSALATQLMEEATARYTIASMQLTIHQDRGAPMIAHRYLDMMAELGVTLSHSRPRVSNDNPMSESQFKTLKYQPDYPGKFQSSAHARQWCEEYFDWYNFQHHHSTLAGFTPAQVFTGQYQEVIVERQRALDQRYKTNPERFVNGRPIAKAPPSIVEINPMSQELVEEGEQSLVNFPTLSSVKERIAG